jgi:hypothetical protein
MAKYVPPNQRGSTFLSDSDSQRWKRANVQEPGSFPTRVSNAADVTEQMSRVHLDDFPALSAKKVEEFPALPTRKTGNSVAAPQHTSKTSYASLASNWAEKAKENEEKEKAKKEAEAALNKRNAKTNMKLIPIRHSVIGKKRTDSDDEVELDIGCNRREVLEDLDPYDVEYEVEEEEVEEEVEEDPDAFWTQRKHKGDIY